MNGFCLFDVLRCPLCKGRLSCSKDLLSCLECRRAYPVVLGIPDLRVYEDPLIPMQDDYKKGFKVEQQTDGLCFADSVRYYWSLPTYPPTPEHLKERFIRHVLTDEDRIGGYCDKLGRGRVLLDVGCGTAALVKKAAARFDVAIGCDVAFRWLLIARKRLQEAGMVPHLVCCCADHLPFADGFADSLTSVSLLEHVAAPGAVLKEFARVSHPQKGRVFTLTSNRFSLTPEPHVRIWGLGFLPRQWMPACVRLLKGMAYEKKHLLSCFELRKLCRDAGLSAPSFSLPVITEDDWKHLQGLERAGAYAFEWLRRIPVLRTLLLLFSPVIQLLAHRSDGDVMAANISFERAESIR